MTRKKDEGYTPDANAAGDLCGRLLDCTEPLPNDPEGRTLSLGVCMFVGVFLSSATIENRQMFVQAALGMSFQAGDILKKVLHAKRE